MLCDNCKNREATIHIKEVHNGKVTTSHLCGECAKIKGDKGELGPLDLNFLFDIAKFNNHDNEEKPDKSNPEKKLPSIVCPVCGWNLEKIRKNNGKLGCQACYTTFKPLIQSVIEKTQRGSTHIGKRPPRRGAVGIATLRFEIAQQQRQLAEHVEREEYEAAAVCRDRINQLKAEIQAKSRRTISARSKSSSDNPEDQEKKA